MKFLKQNAFAIIFGVIGFTMPLLGLLEDEILELVTYLNPFGFIAILLLSGLIESILLRVIILSLIGGVLYMMIGHLIDLGLRTKYRILFIVLIVGIAVLLGYFGIQGVDILGQAFFP